jgi:zinc transporter ZupT
VTPRAAASAADKASGGESTSSGAILLALVPLALLAGLLALLVWWGPADALRVDGHPPVERLTFQRVELHERGITMDVLNDGPDPVTIAQVQVDDAYWTFTMEPTGPLSHMRQTRIELPYPWVEAETHAIRLITSTGVTFDYEVGVALPTPQPSARYFGLFSLIGLYVGVLPVAIGLLWFPWMSRLGRGGLDFVLALTVGLLLFLLVDSGFEGLEAAEMLPESYQGPALFSFAAFGAFLGLELLGSWLRARRRDVPGTGGTAWVLALLIAIGIGIHNLGEGLAIGAAFALGEAGLGALLIIGFTLHNTTEGLAIVAPLARETAERSTRPRVADLLVLGLIGGVPTIVGAWIGGFVYSGVWPAVFLAVGVGAIAQVVVQIVRQTLAGRPLMTYLTSPSVAAGLAVGFLVMYATGMIVG